MRNRDQGSILIVALWTCLILSSLSISLGYHVRQKITLALRLDRGNALYSLAELGVAKGLIEAGEPDTSPGTESFLDSWANSETTFKEIPAGEGVVSVFYEVPDPRDGTMKRRYGMRDEESKININKVDAGTLAALLQLQTGLDDDEAQGIANAIIDWRDSDSLMNHPSYEAEDDYYEDLDLPYEAKDGLFESLYELLLVKGITPEIFEKIKEQVTLYGEGAVNINTASKEVLRVLGLDEKMADRVIAYRAGPDQEESTTDDRYFTNPTTITAEITRYYPLSSSDLAGISNLVASNKLSTKADHFRVHSRGEFPEMRVALDIEAVVDRKGKILFWSAGIPQRTPAPVPKNPKAP